jgi:hypothetical protein
VKRNRPVSLALATLFLWQTGCTSWKQIQLGELPDYDRVRVVSVSTGSTEIEDPVLEADSIQGTVGDLEYSIPLEGVSYVEVKKFNAGATVGAVYLVVLVLAVALYSIACAMEQDPAMFCYW